MRTKITLLSFICLFISSLSFAQTGSTCAEPHLINSLPFSATGLTTQGAGNDYSTSGDCGGNNFMTGEDYVFSFTPTEYVSVNISLTDLTAPGGVGLYILDDCINEPTANCMGADEATTGEPSLSQIGLIPGTTYYIFVSTFVYGTMNTFTGFSINIDPIVATTDDGGVTSISTAPSSCNLSDEAITVDITNFGNNTISNFDLAYRINSGTEVVETYNGSIAPGMTYSHTFATTADMSAPNSYTIEAYTSIATDTVSTNDTLSKTKTHGITISSFPYSVDFESGTSNWFAEGYLNSWEYGIPSTSQTINAAASGSNCWVTNLYGDYNNEESSALYTPCFDFSALLNPMVEMDIWYEMDLGTAYMEYSLNNGYNWTKVGEGEPVDAANWYNADNSGETGWNGQIAGDTWQTVHHTLASLAGEPSVMFRIKFDGLTSGITLNEGVAIDDFTIMEAPDNDLALLNLESPFSNCALGSEIISVNIQNLGDTEAFDIPIKYSLDNGTNYTNATITDTIQGGETYLYSFPDFEDFSITGQYSIIVVMNYPTDENNTNDSLYNEIYHFNDIPSVPFVEDWETNNGGWIAYGTASSWEYGTPSAPIINEASSGNNVWATNLSGNHNTGELSYLNSPCMDLSSLNNPFVRFNIWKEAGTDPTISGYLTLEVSDNGGYSWQELGTTNDGVNWYNSSTVTGWTGNSGDWVNAMHAIDNLSSYNNIQFRFVFSSVLGGDEGFAIDDFEIFDCTETTAQFSSNISLDTVNFANSSSNAESYFWDFGDGNTSTEENPQHIYMSDDTYNVMLVATNNCSADTIYQNVEISTCVAVSADFTYTVSDTEVSFSNTSTNGESYQWNFDDGYTSIEENPVHYYFNQGTYDVSLVVTNECSIDTAHQTITLQSIIELEGNKISIGPNPAQNYLRIQFAKRNHDFQITAFDITGKDIHRLSNKNDNTVVLNLSDLPKGIYLIKIEGTQEIYTERIVKY